MNRKIRDGIEIGLCCILCLEMTLGLLFIVSDVLNRFAEALL